MAQNKSIPAKTLPRILVTLEALGCARRNAASQDATVWRNA